ncbi:hypothetical protein MCHIJ_51530 [Mycolicibacterium chitae]|uniref:MarR family transcriptional regulator n=1 Tax=Mycolicibacterium chitae TaxID=1792 RepID=A0A3S4RFQ6_MYCCI|nr:hypothetical protein MCHIJ_51530 [Mycolicibacterium chitae]VEG49327.1 MarR family transcriptional regulator [Mycolicibacterium chitae]
MLPAGVGMGDHVGLSESEKRSWDAFLESAALVYDRINSALIEAHDVTFFETQVLYILNGIPDRATRMGVLSQQLSLSPSRITQLVRGLESRGFVIRVRGEADKRVVMAQLTRAGGLCLQMALRTYSREVHKWYLAPLSRQQMTALGAIGRQVVERLGYQ